MNSLLNRRKFLRGVMQGSAVYLGLPFLDYFLDGNGQALANGAPIPVRFGTWFWGLGMNKHVFLPKIIGADYDLAEELQAIAPVKKHVNVFSNFRVPTDGKPNFCHYSGWVALRCGEAPATKDTYPNESIDVTIADVLGGGTRFRSLEMAATGDPRDSYSFKNANAINPPEISPLSLYQRVYGSEFRDPRVAQFEPDPAVLARKSILSGVMEDSADLNKVLGSADRARLDEYFTALRELENRLALFIEPPAPAESCNIPETPDELPVGQDWALVAQRHKLMTDILVMALACNQTRIFNMLYSASFSALVKTGVPSTHHSITHEELVNETLGYQKQHSWFIRRAMEAWAYFVKALSSVPEGDGSLLDRTLVFAHSDQETARIHSIDGIPIMTAGSAGGRLKTGMHIDGQGAVASQVGLTLMHALGIPMREWGGGSMRTNNVIDEVLR